MILALQAGLAALLKLHARRIWTATVLFLLMCISLSSCGGGGGPDALPASTQALAVINAVGRQRQSSYDYVNGGPLNGAPLPANLGTITLCSCQL